MSAKQFQLAKQISSCFDPQSVKKEEFEMGIDEAGRGPVFGAMVYGGLWWPIRKSEEFAKLGFNDSKQLNEARREALYQVMDTINTKALFYKTQILTAISISNKMFAQGVHHQNLNQQSHNAAIRLIRHALDEGFNLKMVYVDTVGDPAKYEAKLSQIFRDDNIKITVSKKADSLFKVVSAASIVAKVTRDKLLRDWKFIEPIQVAGELGSGYPSDPKTKEWMQVNRDPVFGYPSLIRFSWGNCVEIMDPPALLFPSEQDQKTKKKRHPQTRLQSRFGLDNNTNIFTT